MGVVVGGSYILRDSGGQWTVRVWIIAPLSLLVSLSVFSLFSPCRLVQVEIVPGGEEAVATRSHYTALHPARIDLKLWAFRASEETTSPGGGWTSGWSRRENRCR